MKEPTVHLYTLCWDEADMLGFFFRHYDSWVDRYVVYDDGSSDGSLDILRAHPKVEIRNFPRADRDSFVRSHTMLQNEIWKESRGQADWVVITAIDEHLWIPRTSMRSYLAEQQHRGVTFIPALGFDMISSAMPVDEGLLIDRVDCGRPSLSFSKLSVFNPNQITQANFGMGRHSSQPQGTLRLPARDELLLWHFKRLGFDRTMNREKAQGARLGRADIASKWGVHYLWSHQEFKANWEKLEQNSMPLDRQNLALVGPPAEDLWWNSYTRATRHGSQPTFLSRLLRLKDAILK